MWLNTTAQTALRAVLYIAERGADTPVRVDDIATALGGPRNYLSKTLHALAREGVLRSSRGPGGGFQLVDPPTVLTLARVVAPFEPADDRRCLVGRPHCGDANPCQAHHRWSTVAAQVESFFGETTIADLAVAPVQLTHTRPTGPTSREELSHARTAR
ncbi:MAG: Rrf2 family transcriptional regulator [Gemmatimonadota bacterium]